MGALVASLALVVSPGLGTLACGSAHGGQCPEAGEAEMSGGPWPVPAWPPPPPPTRLWSQDGQEGPGLPETGRWIHGWR